MSIQLQTVTVSVPYNNDGVPYDKDKLAIDEHLEYFGERVTCEKKNAIIISLVFFICFFPFLYFEFHFAFVVKAIVS